MAKKRVQSSVTKAQGGETGTLNSKAGSKAETTLVFDSALDIAGAAKLHAQLVHALVANRPVVLDTAKVERVDTAALQVLTAFFKDAGAQNLTIQWKDPTQAIKTAARLLGLEESLQLQMY